MVQNLIIIIIFKKKEKTKCQSATTRFRGHARCSKLQYSYSEIAAYTDHPRSTRPPVTVAQQSLLGSDRDGHRSVPIASAIRPESVDVVHYSNLL